jgi:hypothetical protein
MFIFITIFRQLNTALLKTISLLCKPFTRAFIFMLFIFVSFNGLLKAEPLITKVSGNFSDGEIVIVTGSNFGVKDPAKPLIWANFESGNLNATRLGIKSTWDDTQEVSIYANDQLQNSNYCARGNLNTFNSVHFKVSKKHKKHYLYYKERFNFEFSEANCAVHSYFKGPRIWDSSKFLSIYIFYQSEKALSTRTEVSGIKGEDYFADHALPPKENVWYSFEHQTQRNSNAEKSDGTNKIWRNGVLLINHKNVKTHFNGYNEDWENIYLQGYFANGYYCNSSPSIPAYLLFDDIYIDTTWQRVMIGDKQDFSKCTHREIMIPTKWTNEHIEIIVNMGALNSTSIVNYYLFVVDSNGNTNQLQKDNN